MRQDPTRPALGGQVPLALRGRASLRAAFTTAVAAAIGFVPAIVVSSPAFAAAGDVTISSDLEVTEDDVASFDLKREGGIGLSPVTLTYSVVPGTATPGQDYTAITGTTTFAASTRDTVKRFNVRGIADLLDEDDETFTFTVVDENGDPVASASGTLADDDATPTYELTVPDAPVGEAGSSVTVTATLSAISGRDVSIPVSTGGGTATAGADYTTLTNQPILIEAGERTGTITVPILEDDRDEPDTETFTVTGGAGTNVSGTDSVGVQIADDDALPVIGVSDPGNAVEGSAVTFQVTLSEPSDREVTVVANTSNGTATAGQDYTAVAAQTVTFAPGDTSENVVVTTATDLLDEVNPETLTLALSAPSNATLDTVSSATGNIDDDDDRPTVTLTPGSVTEGDTGTATKTFTVTLDAASGREVTVGYDVSDGTATAGTDFNAVTAGTLVFAPGETVKTFAVQVRGDTIDEVDETFNVVLSNPEGTVGPSASLGTTAVTLTDDDATPTLATFADITRAEGTGPANFVLTLSNASAQAITLDVDAADGTADVDGTGPGSNDYDAPDTTVTFLPGEVSKTIPVNINADSVYEGDEDAEITVSIPGGEADVTGPGRTATLTLTNDDAAPSVVLSSASGAEGTSINLTGAVTGVAQDALPVEITLAGAAVSGSNPAEVDDFENSGATTVNIPAGDNTGMAVPLRTIVLEDDNKDEPNETVVATLSDPDDVIATTTAVQTITDDPGDLPPTVAVLNATVDENDPYVDVDVELQFDADTNDATETEVPVVVGYTTANGTAVAGSDYTAAAGGSTITFAPGDLTQQIRVPVTNDSAFERDETFLVNLTSATPTGAVITDASGTVTISENDLSSRPTFSIANATQEEDEDDTANLTVSLSHESSQAVTFTVDIADGTADDAGTGPGSNDYDAPDTTLTIPAGSQTGVVEVPVNADSVFEGNETATVSVALAGGETDATGPLDAATLTIEDDDAAPTISLSTESGAEGTEIVVAATVTGVAQDNTVFDLTLEGYSGEGRNAAESTDFVDSGATATIPGGTASGSTVNLRTFRLNNDTIDEPVETIRVTAQDVDENVATASALQGINDDPGDLPPSVSINDETIDEFEGSVDVGLSLSFEGSDTTATEQDIEIPYWTYNGTARAGDDYTAEDGTVTISAGDLTGNLNVVINGDEVDEPNQTFGVKIGSVTPSAAEITDDTGIITIFDDDETVNPTLSAPGYRIGAGTVTVQGMAREGTSVQLWVAPFGEDDFKVVAYATAGVDGSYSFSRYLSTGHRMYTRANGLTSPIRIVRVAQAPVLTGGSTARGTVALKVVGNPKAGGQTVQIQRANTNGTWTTVASGKTDGNGAFSRTFTGLRSGSAMYFRAYIPTNTARGEISGFSAAKRIVIR